VPRSVEDQGDLFPRCTPATIALALERTRRRVVALAPALSVGDCARVLGEVALLDLLLDRLERQRELAARFMLRDAPGRHVGHLTAPVVKPPAWAVRHDARRAAPEGAEIA
jgi:hypothetical protein